MRHERKKGAKILKPDWCVRTRGNDERKTPEKEKRCAKAQQFSGVKRAEADDRSQPPTLEASLRSRPAGESQVADQSRAGSRNLRRQRHRCGSHTSNANMAPSRGQERTATFVNRNVPDSCRQPRPQRGRPRTAARQEAQERAEILCYETESLVRTDKRISSQVNQSEDDYLSSWKGASVQSLSQLWKRQASFR